MVRRKTVRRAVGATLVILGALTMLLAPESTFGARSLAGLVLLIAGIGLELVGIALEHRNGTRRKS